MNFILLYITHKEYEFEKDEDSSQRDDDKSDNSSKNSTTNEIEYFRSTYF